MSTTLIVELEPEVMALAEQEAQARHTTLPAVVGQHLRVMARNRQESRAGRTPVTDALRGTVQLPADFDRRATLTEALQQRHGLEG